MTRFAHFALAVLLAAFTGVTARAAEVDRVAAPADKPHIDIVFCVDCSGSMGPVIDTAKRKVWAIVNEVAKAKPSPVLRIGLLGYGNADRAYRKFDLSDDLDEVYKNLITFKDEGWGDEFVGRAVNKATEEMKWADGKKVLKVIYVVGNETARQGPPEFDYTKTAPAAIAKGIIVNAIYCGNVDYATATPTWREMAKLADGQYMEIAATGGAVIVATPFDDELAKLSGQLNTTYVAYGHAPARVEAMQKQVAQDQNASGLGGAVAADRAVAKSGLAYNNARWDLIDAQKNQKDFDLKKLKEEELPDELRKLPAEQRQAYLDKKAAERNAVQKQIAEISAKRDQYIKEEVQKKGLSGDKAFDEAVRGSVMKQAESKGFTFDKQ